MDPCTIQGKGTVNPGGCHAAAAMPAGAIVDADFLPVSFMRCQGKLIHMDDFAKCQFLAYGNSNLFRRCQGKAKTGAEEISRGNKELFLYWRLYG